MEFVGKETNLKELHLEAQLCMVIVFSFLSLALFVETLLLGWETWTLPVIAAAVIVMWGTHISQRFTETYRVYLYLFLTMVELFFYGSHLTSLFDMPVLVILILGVFALSEEDAVPLWVVALYLFVLFYHAPSLKALAGPLEISRIVLGIVGVVAAASLSIFAIRRRREENRRFNEMTQALIGMNERTENFLTNVSHELRTPINAVSGITEVLLKNESDPQKRDSLLAVQQAGRRLFSQISDILDYTEIDTDRLVVVEEPYMISSLLNDILTEVQLMHYADGLELIFDVDSKLPEALIGDSAKIKKILRHLIENGCKFTREGGVYVRVEALQKAYGINLCLSVCDTGSGIPENERSRLAASFYQGDSSRSRKAGGLGLGLPIVQGLTLSMGGFMHIDDARGGGALVRVSIPQKIASTAPCMSVENAESLCVACYLKPEKYSSGAIRDYYSMMIANLASSLHIDLHSVSTLRDLRNLQQTYALTHVFVGSVEYAISSDYFERLPEEIVVTVVAEPDFVMPAGTRCRLIWKPFNSVPIVSILNNENVKNVGVQGLFQKRFICPNVKALVVDDDEMNLIVAKGILGEYRMQVSTATSGAECLQMCAREDFDIVFMDHMMPEMDGVEAMRQLRKLMVSRAKVPAIVALTANAVSGAREMFLQEGFNGFVPKPIETNELEHVLKKVLPVTAFAQTDGEGIEQKLSPAASMPDPDYVAEAAAPAAGKKADAGSWLSALAEKGVDTQAAIGYCANSQDFYREMLVKYHSDAALRLQELSGSAENGDCKLYEIKVHALKSASKTVGLNELAGLALSLETAAKAGDLDLIRAEHPRLTAMLTEAVAMLASALNLSAPAAADEKKAAGGGQPAEKQGPEEAEVSQTSLQQDLTALKAALDMFEGEKAAAAVAGILSAAPASCKEELLQVQALIADFELGRAAEIVQNLLVKGGEQL